MNSRYELEYNISSFFIEKIMKKCLQNKYFVLILITAMCFYSL